MDQQDRNADEPTPSPCVRNCCLNDKDICLGCFRTLTEILRWGEANNVERQQILANAQHRQDNKGSMWN